MVNARVGHRDRVTPTELSPLWRSLAERVVAEYRAALGDDLLAVACFGSVARGEPTSESDLDLYLVTRNPVAALSDKRLERIICLRETREYQALHRQGFRPDPMPIFHSAEKLATHPWILLDIVDHGLILHDPEAILGQELDVIRRRLEELGSKRIQRPDGSWYWDLKPDWHPGETISL